VRFRRANSPVRAIAAYLRAVHAEAVRRGYRFDAGKIGRGGEAEKIPVTRGQVEYEWGLLKEKLARRSPARLEKIRETRKPRVNPVFRIVRGRVETWEKVRKHAKLTILSTVDNVHDLFVQTKCILNDGSINYPTYPGTTTYEKHR
jgi:hypothetical protein